MRFTLQHPSESHCKAVYGFDAHLKWFVEVRARGRLIDEYDALTTERSTMTGALQVMVEHGFFEAADFAEAADTLQELDVEDIEDPDTRRAAEVLVKLKAAAE